MFETLKGCDIVDNDYKGCDTVLDISTIRSYR